MGCNTAAPYLLKEEKNYMQMHKTKEIDIISIKKKREKSRQLRQTIVAYSFLLPNFAGFVIFTMLPIIFAVVLSFCNWDGNHPIEFVGIKNYLNLGTDARFQAALVNTIAYCLGHIPLTMVCSLGLAVLLNRKLKGRNIFRTLAFFPYVASLVAVAVVWNMLFNPQMGPVNMILNQILKIPPQSLPGWAADKDWAMITVVMFSIWKSMGYYMVIYLAGLQGIPSDLYESASLDGATGWQKFHYITWPMLLATTFFVLVMMTIASFKVYDLIYMLTQGGPGTSTLVLVYHIYNTAFVNGKYGYASCISMVLFVIVLAVTIIQFTWEKKHADY